MEFELIRDAKVVAKQHINAKRQNVAEIVVNDKYHHRFPATSRVSKHLDLMTPADLSERLTGGSFFFIGDQLVDFRDGSYNGFVHDTKTIGVLMELLGWQHEDDMPMARRRSRSADEETNTRIVLRKVWDKSEIVVPGYAQGADFRTELSFVWNPYVKTINSAFDLIRLICTNGMVGLTSFLNTKVPLFNRWEEHLDIACRQIQNKVNSTMLTRIDMMNRERASLADVLLLEQHATNRLYSGSPESVEERNRLSNLLNVLDTRAHLQDVYREGVFTDKNLAAQLPSHLTHYDAFNIATEMRTHTNENSKSSSYALDRFANNILFDNDRDFASGVGAALTPKVSPFSDAERAFYGVM